MNDVSLLVPWRAGDPWRERVWRWLEAAWRAELPDVEICTGDDDKEPFSRAAALNSAADKASGDILVVLDADTWLEPAGLREAVAQIRAGRRWVPKARKVFLGQDDTERLVGRPWRGFPTKMLERSGSDRFTIPAPVVVARSAWVTVNGFDERFRGWGCEDNAFILALKTLAPDTAQGEGTAVHLWHPNKIIDGWQVWSGQRTARPGLAHLRLYHRAYRRPDSMVRLVSGNRGAVIETSRSAAFRKVWQRNLWRGAETRSGPGSGSQATTALRTALPTVLESCRSVLDVGCGDCFWQPELPGYVGIDIVPEAVAAARIRHPRRHFLVLDGVAGPLPRADAVLCRDTFTHLSLADGLTLLANIRATGAKVLVATTFIGGVNIGADATDHYRPDMTSAPFNLGPPRLLLPDGQHPGYVVPEKQLGVWDLA